MAHIIAFEGLPGTGKSCVIALLKHLFEKKGYRVGVFDIDSSHDAPLLHKKADAYPAEDPARSTLLWTLRLQQGSAVIAALSSVDIVFIDGFWGKTVAYDVYGNEHHLDLESWFKKHLEVEVAITFLFEASFETISARQRSRTMRKPSFAKRVREGYRILAEKNSWVVINAEKEAEAIARECFDYINALL